LLHSPGMVVDDLPVAGNDHEEHGVVPPTTRSLGFGRAQRFPASGTDEPLDLGQWHQASLGHHGDERFSATDHASRHRQTRCTVDQAGEEFTRSFAERALVGVEEVSSSRVVSSVKSMVIGSPRVMDRSAMSHPRSKS
jgi:hypothetical protein